MKAITKPSNKNHGNTTKEVEFVKKMKKARSSDLDTLKHPSLRRHERSDQPREQPPSSSPGYMKSTSCSEARKEQKQLARSLNHSKGKCSTSTCSSLLKDSKVPTFLDLSPGGTESQGASMEQVCPYSHCSLNSHKNDSNPPLKSFLLARRMALKKPKEDDVVENENGEAITVLFVEEKANATNITALDGLFSECSNVELEEGTPRLGIGDGIYAPSDQESDHTFMHPSGDEILCLLDEEGVKKDNDGIQFLKEFSQDEITNCHVQFSDSEPSLNDGYEEEMVYYQFLQDSGCSGDEKIEKSSGLDKKIIEASEAENEGTKDSPKSDGRTISPAKIGEERSINEVATELLNDDLGEQAVEEDLGSCQDAAANESENPSFRDSDTCKSLKNRIRGRKEGESSEGLKPFNPREPNYLELEPDAGAEKVDLRHQETDERRNAEEWMLDYALRKAVNQLAAARERKVGLLVEAFETITPPTKSRG